MENCVVTKAQGLTDIQLAILLCLVADQHCIIETEETVLNLLQDELCMVASDTFGLSAVVLHCSEATTLDDFSNGVLIPRQTAGDPEVNKKLSPTPKNSSFRLNRSEPVDELMLPNTVIVRSLNLSGHQIQIQALELLRTNRIFTHTAVYAAPKPFLMVALVSVSSAPFVKHLNDHIFLSHFHSPEDGFANLDEGSEWVEDDQASLSSVIHKSVASKAKKVPLFTIEDIHLLSSLSKKATIRAEVGRYLHNILTFLRMNRAVAGGISPRATKHFELLVKCLAPLHELEFVTPSLVALAAVKIYRHRIAIVAPEDERSMQYGSDLATVTAYLEGISPETVIEQVLAMVEAPL